MLVLLALATAARPLEKAGAGWRFGAEDAKEGTLTALALKGGAPAFAVNNGTSLMACAYIDEAGKGLTVEATKCEGESLQCAPCATDAEHVLVAEAKYDDALEQVGWGYLAVKSHETSGASDDVQVYAAGLLEGLLTSKRVGQFRRNADAGMAGMEEQHHAVHNIQALFENEIKYIENTTGLVQGAWADQPEDRFKRYVRSVFLQTRGVLDGTNAMHEVTGDKPMTLVDLFLLNSDGETPELQMAEDVEEQLLRQSQHGPDASLDSLSFVQTSKFLGSVRREPSLMEARRLARREAIQDLTPEGWAKIKRTSGRCSALVRVAPDQKDLYVGHATFSDFSEMLRIFKFYDFPLSSTPKDCSITQGAEKVQGCRGGKASRTLGFSSYPGLVTSTDDYYVLSSGLVVTETTISLLTDEPYDKLDDTGHMYPDFIRVMAASWAADSGEAWVDMMKKSATGTYASQWMVVDYAQFEQGQPIKDKTLMVLEQVPGLSHGEDMSERLRKDGYWASENRAFFPDVRDVSGYADAEMMHGKLFSAEHNPRANIFGATAPKVASIQDFGAEMRRNRWPHEVDGGPENSADHAISARSDLLPGGRKNANGGVDAKVTDACMVSKLSAFAISGPTEDQKVFEWSKDGRDLWPDVYHEGLPNKFNFPWLRMTPTGYQRQSGTTLGADSAC